jgi:hypothetical protein
MPSTAKNKNKIPFNNKKTKNPTKELNKHLSRAIQIVNLHMKIYIPYDMSLGNWKLK